MVLNLYLFDYTISLLTLTKLKYLSHRIQCLNKNIFKVTPLSHLFQMEKLTGKAI